MSDIDRRDFVKQTTAAGLGILANPRVRVRSSANETVRVAVLGVCGAGSRPRRCRHIQCRSLCRFTPHARVCAAHGIGRIKCSHAP